MKHLMAASLFLLLSSCSHVSSGRKPLRFEELSKISVGASSEYEVVELFGIPAERDEESSGVNLRYKDPKDGFERLVLKINSAKTVVGYAWIPRAGEVMSTIREVRSHFKNAKFIDVPQTVPEKLKGHTLSSMMSTLKDDAAGISVNYHVNQGWVEAIGIFQESDRKTSQIR